MEVPIESGLEVVDPKPPTVHNVDKQAEVVIPTGHETNWLKQNLRIILFILLAVVLVAAIIGGAVGGTLHNRHKPSTSPPETNGTRSAPGSLPTANSQQVSSCRNGICPLTISSITWSDIQFVFAFSTKRSLVYKAGSNNQWNSTWS